MMGSYDDFIKAGLLSPKSRSDAGWSALANLSSQLINRGAPRYSPTPPPMDLGAVMGAYNKSMQNDLQRGLAMHQFKRSEDEYARKEMQRDSFANMLKPQTVETMDQDMAPMTVQQPSALMQSIPATMRPIFRGLVEGGKAPEAFASLFAAGIKDNTPPSIKTLNYIDTALGNLPANSPQRATLQNLKTKLLTPPGTNVSVSTAKGAGEQVLDSVKNIQATSGNAMGILEQMTQLESLINQGAKTGFGQQTITQANKLLRALGISNANVSTEEQFLAITTEAAISNVKKLGVNPTDKDLEMVFQAGPQLATSREGNLALIAAAKEKARRTIARADFLNNYALENIDQINKDPLRFLLQKNQLLLNFDKQQKFGSFKFTAPSTSPTAVPSIFQ